MATLGIPSESAEQIASLLHSNSLISENDLKSAMVSSDEGEKCLIETLIDFRFTDEKTIATAISSSYDIEFLPSLDTENIDFSTSDILPKKYITENRIVPISIHGHTLDVAISEPSALNQMQSIALLTDKKVNPYLVTISQITKILDSFNTIDPSSASAPRTPKLLKANSSNKAAEKEKAIAAAKKSEPQMPTPVAKKAKEPAKAQAAMSDEEVDEKYSAVVVQFIDTNLKKAIKEGVSDVHFEVFKHSARMRFRLDGVLMEEPGTSKVLYDNYSKIITRIKIMSKLDIAERRKAQDGAITLKVDEKEVDFRVSCMPTSFGERVVMRILDTDGIDLSIEKLGFHEDDEKAFIDAISSPQGMVLVTGPTGSGKSTTLYAALNKINKEDINILTAEDPVEFTLNGVGQVHVKPDYGMTFASALRSFLRQDPEVVMVGEIRDQETVEIAIKAALTGHLVLSTLHTNDAVSTITRILNMGVQPYLITSALTLIVAQRLARKNCSECLIEDEDVNESQLRAVGFSAEESTRVTLFKGGGCDTCNGTGYKGRKGIYEVLRITENLIEGILQEKTTPELKKIALEKDKFLNMQEIGRTFLKDGSISIDEYKRILILD
ncbi:ATPase, T2SS/T4P/T4SS family [Candidatus Thioglobus sp.]|nr:ATPase, T2SS/T4P/T4SS family [Candidatus Thioglobus sp.]MDA9319495.1 ATPase, T2SS/T4P/T4SS family [Candidatus Thioglobus sp.]MDA9319523.1 ATPase, T2SS/T4P/T4SS family [Candidatus Thioglobus sp.]MDC1450565.1 ATPase, T2SS/T4P/T4SS family [Candidatus Thioglobus sp.]